MLNLRTKRSLVYAVILSLLVAIALPTVAFADKGRGRGQDRRYERRDDRRDGRRDGKFDRRQERRGRNHWQQERKSRRFINGHDARDGRWGKRWERRNRSFDGWGRNDYRYRNRSRYNTRYYRSGSQRSYDDIYVSDRYNADTGGLFGALLGGFLSGN